MNEELLGQVTVAVRHARLAWEAAHRIGALEAGGEPDAYIAHIAVRAMLAYLERRGPADP